MDGARRLSRHSRARGAPPIPEQSTWAMLLAGFIGLGALALRRRLAVGMTGCARSALPLSVRPWPNGGLAPSGPGGIAGV